MVRAARCLPSSRSSPAVGLISRARSRASVDLPEPLSPTIAVIACLYRARPGPRCRTAAHHGAARSSAWWSAARNAWSGPRASRSGALTVAGPAASGVTSALMTRPWGWKVSGLGCHGWARARLGWPRLPPRHESGHGGHRSRRWHPPWPGHRGPRAPAVRSSAGRAAAGMCSQHETSRGGAPGETFAGETSGGDLVAGIARTRACSAGGRRSQSGSWRRSGGEPPMPLIRRCGPCSAGNDLSSPREYGCRGARYSCWAPPTRRAGHGCTSPRSCRRSRSAATGRG